jgi:hypothetical protein
VQVTDCEVLRVECAQLAQAWGAFPWDVLVSLGTEVTEGDLDRLRERLGRSEVVVDFEIVEAARLFDGHPTRLPEWAGGDVTWAVEDTGPGWGVRISLRESTNDSDAAWREIRSVLLDSISRGGFPASEELAQCNDPAWKGPGPPG